MQKLNISKYRLLNIGNTLSELFMFLKNHSIVDRVKDVEKICSVRSQEENLSEEDALSLLITEVMITRIVSLILVISSLAATLYLASIGMEILSIVCAILPLTLVVGGAILKIKMIKKFKDEKIHFQTY